MQWQECVCMAKSNFLWGLTVCIMPHIHFGEAEAAYCHPQTWKPWLCMINVQLMYQLYGECSKTVHTCMNSGYEVLFSPHRVPGNEAKETLLIMSNLGY